ncbi:MAG: hypothetical protein JWQ71_515 [Pedosphaera sp.]|nr:hypothetical protein [Pedosphaera sp.]
MNRTYEIIRGTLILIVAVSAVLWVLWKWLKNSPDPAKLITKWVATVGIALGVFFGARAAFKAGGYASLHGISVGLVGGLILAIIWTPNIVDAVGRRMGGLFDGGDEEVDPTPFYSIFNAKRAKGQYQEALAEIRKQLEKFPTDFEGMMLLAALQAENLNDLPGAEVTVHRFYSQPGHPPKNIAYALNRLADWHLGLHKDRDAAQQALEKIIELLPESEMSLQASQRIAHLADTEMLVAAQQRQRVIVKKGAEDIGLLKTQEHLKVVETDPGKLAEALVKHLEKHPLDGAERERLAVIYANHYQRMDLAAEQLEQLIQQPNQPVKNVVHWLNLLADLQVQNGSSLEDVQATLQRIIDQYPDLAAAENAQRRLDRVKLEMKAKGKSQAVKLGSYEQDIGLKGRQA